MQGSDPLFARDRNRDGTLHVWAEEQFATCAHWTGVPNHYCTLHASRVWQPVRWQLWWHAAWRTELLLKLAQSPSLPVLRTRSQDSAVVRSQDGSSVIVRSLYTECGSEMIIQHPEERSCSWDDVGILADLAGRSYYRYGSELSVQHIKERSCSWEVSFLDASPAQCALRRQWWQGSFWACIWAAA